MLNNVVFDSLVVSIQIGLLANKCVKQTKIHKKEMRDSRINYKKYNNQDSKMSSNITRRDILIRHTPSLSRRPKRNNEALIPKMNQPKKEQRLGFL